MESGRWMNKFRILTMVLIFSGAMNIGLLAAFIFSAFSQGRTGVVSLVQTDREQAEPANRQLLAAMCKLSFPELVTYLTNRERVEEGYAKRDLALSALIACHHFNLEKALSGLPAQRRLLALSPDLTVEIYPSLSEEDYEAVIRFAYQEKWPLTARGLFQLLKKWPKNTRDSSLEQAFFVTPEFHAVQVLFQKTQTPQENALLLDLVLEGSWEFLENFAQEQAQALDLSIDKRRAFLMKYTAIAESSAAALLFLKTDMDFARMRLEDREIMALLSLLKEKSLEAVQFCKSLLRAPRSDAVWQAAAERLYAYEGEEMRLPFDCNAVIARFDPSAAPVQVLPVKAAPAPKPMAAREYIVKEGDTLWKIARLHKMKVDDLVRFNALEKERLLPGMILRIP